MALFGGKSTREDINLIPENQQEVKVSKNRKGITIFVVLVTVFVILLFAAVFVQKQLALAQKKKIENDRKTQLSIWEKEASSAAEILATKTKLTKLKNLTEAQANLEGKLASLADSTPAKVQITNLALDAQGKAQVVGRGANAAAVYQYIEVLKSEKELFSQVNLTSISKKEEGSQVEFTVTFRVN